MNYCGMSPRQIGAILECNEKRRDNLLEMAKSLDSESARARFVVDYFTNKLPKETIASIDEVEENKVSNFSYDYSYIKGNSMFETREQKSVGFSYSGGYVSGKTIMSTGNDIFIEGRPKIFPSIFALKMGTCTMFAHEMKRLMHELDVPCDLIETDTPIDCYDLYSGKDEAEGTPINVNGISKIYHAYNIITLNGEPLKVDIAGYLTAQDFNEKHPIGRENPIDPDNFYFSQNINENPFQGADNPTL